MAARRASRDEVAIEARSHDDPRGTQRVGAVEGTKRGHERLHARGYAFEAILADLFLLYDFEPRLSYRIDLEQIDGSISFDTDDYIVEARWRAEQADRADGDIFAAQVTSKGKNAMGLFVSVNGFNSAFLERFKASTPLITMDGTDLYVVLSNLVRLDDLLRAKKRHANDTGSCYLPVKELM